MIPFFSLLQFRFGHISDETLANLVSGDLRSFHSVRVNAHLGRCWQCRTRRDELENAAKLVVHYRNGNLASCLPLDPGPRQVFLAKLRYVTPEPRLVSRWLGFMTRLRVQLLTMNPVFASAVVVTFASILLFGIWQRSTTTVPAGELLRKAEAADLEISKHTTSGVLYQQVAVRAGNVSFRHAIYRDLAGRRRQRPVRLNPEESEIEQKLVTAGVNWESPLSAADYKDWHDRQRGVQDAVRRTSQSELTLTTTLDSGEISEESLTVRESDFHPIRRTVEMRDEATIEIAELDFAVLGWNAVNGDLFEPATVIGATAPVLPAMRGILPLVLPSAMEIDAAELDVRIALNQLGADKQDQIRIAPTDTGIVVKGIVGTNQRKRELIARLNQIPLAHPQILSTEEVQAHPNSFRTPTHGEERLEVYSAPPEISPLARYIEEKRLDPSEQSVISKRLVEASLHATQAGLQLAELNRRFLHISGMPQPSQEQFASLSSAYRTEVLQALATEQSGLAEIGFDEAPRDVATTPSLEQAVEANQQFCQELIVGASGQTRPATAIAADIMTTAKQIITTINTTPPLSKP